MKKKGVEAYFLPIILLAIVGFFIVLYFLVSFDLTGYSEDEVCKLSILSRATSPDAAKGVVPIQCTTKKLCLTKDGDCRKNFAGEKPEVVKLSSDENGAIKQISKASADAMLDCWKMMGEGKLDLFGGLKQELGFEQGRPACVICSRIAVDNSVVVETLNKIDINEYMRTSNVEGLGINYISALTEGGAVSYAKTNPIEQKNAFEKFEEGKTKIELSGTKEPNREMAIVFMQFKPASVDDVLTNMAGIGGTVAGATFLSPIGLLARPVIANPIGGGLALIGVGTIVGYGMYNAYYGQLAAAGYCGKFATSGKDPIEGCSMVQGINYNVRDINAVCPQIQGNP